MMDMHTEFAPNGMFMFLAFLPIVFYLLLIIFGIYFVVKVIKFMNEKMKVDRIKNERLDELIKVLKQDKN